MLPTDVTEYEVKVLNVSARAVAKWMRWSGTKQIAPRHLQRRKVYDIRPGDESTWVRLRDTGTGTVTWCIKEIRHDGIDGTDEWEVKVSDFDTADVMLGKLGYVAKAYQENYRTSWVMKGGVAVELDEWPGIPPYLELEGPSEEKVKHALWLLKLTGSETTSENTTKVYARYGMDLTQFPELTFDKVPVPA